MNKRWLKAALIRAVKTVAQTAVATIGTTAVIEQVDWKVVASASILAGILSMLTSIGGLPEVSSNNLPIMDKPELNENYWEDKDYDDGEEH